MHFLNLDLYKPTKMELWINKKYKEHGIHSPSDMEIDRIAAVFNAHIAYTESETKVLYDDDNDCLIFLNIYLEVHDQRLAFFHELCHPAMHSGNQHNLPDLFVDLQETQAAQFQLYAAMPVYMLQSFETNQPNYLAMLSEAFRLPYSFVRSRIEQIQRRVNRERQDRNLRARSTPKPTLYSYTDETKRILDQLHRQIAERKGQYNAGR